MKSRMVWVLSATTGFMIGMRFFQRGSRKLPSQRLWFNELTKETTLVEAGMILGKTSARYHELLSARPLFNDYILRWHLEENILPGLALYQTLLAENGSREQALARTGRLLNARARQRFAPLQSISKQPWFFPLFRRAVRLQMAYQFPTTAWEREWLRDDDQAIAFTMHSCFYHQVLTMLGAPELTPVFCHTDEAGMEVIEGIIFQRTGTIGLGAPRCDFCYQKALLR